MEPLISYLWKSVVIAGILTAYYWWMLRDRKFHRYNRFYLLSVLVISLVLPLCRFTFYRIQPAPGVLAWFGPDQVVEKPVAHFSWQSGLSGCIALVSVLLLVRQLFMILRIFGMRRRFRPVKAGDIHFIQTDLPEAPFSFFNLLFWRGDILTDSENGRKIFLHECAHIRGRHSYDRLFSQVVTCVFWINPVFWIIQKELTLVHEYIADSESIEDGNVSAFAEMLLHSYSKGQYLEPVHTFFNSSIKRRLTMITTSQKTSFSYGRRILVIPVALLVSALFTFGVARAQDSTSKKAAEKEELNKKAAEQEDRKKVFEREYYLAHRTPEQKMADEKEEREKFRRQVTELLENLPPATYIINGRESSRETVLKLDPAKVKMYRSLYVPKGKEEGPEHLQSPWGREIMAKYGDKARDGIIEFTTE